MAVNETKVQRIGSCGAAPGAPPSTDAALVAEIRALIVGGRPTFHVFGQRQDLLLYDLCSGSLVGLNAVTFALLSALEQGLADGEVVRRTLDAGAVNVREYLEEVRELHSLGLFRLEPVETPGERSEVLARLRAHKQRNLMLMVQTSCNLACDYCYEVQSGFHHTGGKMSFEMAKASIDEYLERTGERVEVTVTFFGGEPLLNFEVVRKSVAYCRERAAELGKTIGFSMTTNGTLLSQPIVEFLVENEFTMMVSLDGAPEKADVRRHDLGGVGATAKALKGALALLRAQRSAGLQELSVRATLTKENASKREVYDFFHRAGFRRIVISNAGSREEVNGPWQLDEQAHATNARDYEALLERYVEWVRGGADFPERRQLALGIQRVQLGLNAPKIPASLNCGVGNNMLATTQDGKMYPCHRFAGEEGHVLGNVNGGGVDQAQLNRFYKSVLNAQDEVCSGCWARFTCGRPCPWTFSKKEGGIGSIANQTCNRIRDDLEKSLWVCAKVAGEKKQTVEGTTTDVHEKCL